MMDTGAHLFNDVILVEDDLRLLEAQVQGLELEGFRVQAFGAATDALNAIGPDFAGVVITDVRMDRFDGLDLYKAVHAMDPDIPVILQTGHGDVPMAVQALKSGVYDFITKPFLMETLYPILGRAIHQRRLVLENRQLREAHEKGRAQEKGRDAKPQLLGSSPAMLHLQQLVAQVGQAGIDVLVQGETGVGKERVARTLHRLSPRSKSAFVHVNCTVLSEESFDVDLFGSAGTPRKLTGRLEAANKGTLFLDDVEGLSLPQQAKLLRLIETQELWPAGASEPKFIDIRVIAASRTDIGSLVEAGRFRADLFYRLSGVTIKIPAIRERRSDVSELFQNFLVEACVKLKRPVPALTPDAYTFLHAHDWPGNVRELEQFAERYALGLFEGQTLKPVQTDLTDGPGLQERLAKYEAELLQDTLAACQGDAKRAISALKLPRKTFYDKLTRYQIRIGDFRK